MSAPRRVRRPPRPRRAPSPYVLLVAGLVVSAACLALVGFGLGTEISHRVDPAWRYERLPLTNCSVDLFQAYNQPGTDYLCYAASTPARPADHILVDTTSRSGAPRSDTRWVHVTAGTIDRVGGGHIPLWLGLFLLVPLGLLAGLVGSVRRAHRAGLRWRDRPIGRPRRRAAPLHAPESSGGATPF